MKRKPATKKISTVRVNGNMTFKRPKLTIGLDLGDRWSFYCVRFRCQRSKLTQIVAVQIDARFLFW
jgi:hypothetical protein